MGSCKIGNNGERGIGTLQKGRGKMRIGSVFSWSGYIVRNQEKDGSLMPGPTLPTF
jgi:hypothetical protein